MNTFPPRLGTSDLGRRTRNAVAAMNGDWFTWHGHRPSGLTVIKGAVLTPGWQGAPTAGFERGGRLVFGTPLAFPVSLRVRGRRFGLQTAGRSAPLTLRRRVGWTAAGPTQHAFLIRDRFPNVVSPAGRFTAPGSHGRVEALHEPGHPMRTRRPMLVSLAAAGAYRVPRGGWSLLLARRGSIADRTLTRAAGSEGASVSVTEADAAWASVKTTIGGLPFLYRNGRATSRPPYFDPTSWNCFSCYKTVLATFADGRAAMVEIQHATDPRVQRILRSLGRVSNAVAFDDGGSSTLWTHLGHGGCLRGQTGLCFGAQPANERHVANAVVLRRLP